MTKQLKTNDHVDEKAIIHYLTEHSDFFIHHPQLLETLKVNNLNGTVASLVNHQVSVLQDRNKQLKSRLAELISYAEGNEKIMSQVFELTLQLCQISHVSNVTKHFSRFVKKSFSSDMFKIVVPHDESLENSTSVLCINDNEKFTLLFSEFMKNNRPVCGRLRKDMLEFVFGKSSAKIGSCVMLPIGKNAAKGILVFASNDENSFNAEMSTDLLSKLTHILDKKFKKTFSIDVEKQA